MSKPNKRKIYYAIAGTNGYGIYTNVKSASKSVKYLSNWRYEVFYDVEEAVRWATHTISALNGNSVISIYPITRFNWLFYKEKPRRRFIYDD